MQDRSASSKKSLVTFKNIVFVILIILVIIFIIQNTQPVEVKFLPWKLSLPSAVILLGTFLVGLIVGWLARRVRPRKQA
ncbi:MAG: LapA family protein [Deltaproteobacteria bacterium]|nr:LapA family protein [Deltaproteobacteria bacterium]